VFLYKLYGLTVESSTEIHFLDRIRRVDQTDVTVQTESTAVLIKGSSLHAELLYPLGSQVSTAFSAWRSAEGYRLRWEQTADYCLDLDGSSIRVIRNAPTSWDAVFALLVGPVARFLLRIRGIACLHASAVLMGDRAIVFAGDFRTGKSTTAAAFAKHRVRVLAEDIVGLSEEHGLPYVRPGYPRINLRPESMAALFPTLFPELDTIWGKQYLDLRGQTGQFCPRQTRMGIIYLLSERLDDTRAPFVQHLTLQEALLALTANSFSTYLLDETILAREFQVFSKIVSQVPVRKLVPHVDISRLDDLVDLVIADTATLIDNDVAREMT
jgi:hypothetical protein